MTTTSVLTLTVMVLMILMMTIVTIYLILTRAIRIPVHEHCSEDIVTIFTFLFIIRIIVIYSGIIKIMFLPHLLILFKCLFLYYILIVGRHQPSTNIRQRFTDIIDHQHQRSALGPHPRNQLSKGISSSSAKLISAESWTGINPWTQSVMILTFKRNDDLDKLCVNFVKYIIEGDGKSLRKWWVCIKKVFLHLLFIFMKTYSNLYLQLIKVPVKCYPYVKYPRTYINFP